MKAVAKGYNKNQFLLEKIAKRLEKFIILLFS